ncbi:MAG: hypothetical protein WAN03_14635 [Candidatus Sulfotelmatobacter sp.]
MGDETVAGQLGAWDRVDVVDDVGVDLAKGDQGALALVVKLRSTGQPRGAVPTYVAEKDGSVALYGGAVIVFGEAQVQVAFAVGAGESTDTGGKAMQQPRKLI